MPTDFFTKARELELAGEPFAIAIVVRSERPTSGKPGDKAIVTADGRLHGWIGGSCARPVVVEAALAALVDHRPRLVRITPEPTPGGAVSGLEEVAMTCFSGGTVDVFVEPEQPSPRLLVIGQLPVAQALVHLGKVLGYRTHAIDFEGDGTTMAHADELSTDLGAIAPSITPHTYVVVATHGASDELALEKVLRATPPYVGLVASRKRAGAILEELRRQGLSEAELAPLKNPAGLDLGARSGEEIALSILAEIVQLRRSASASQGG